MDTKLLRSWLGLPQGDWPPVPHDLLGPADAGVHERALALMERLRPHQLRHPELVTEGMNRLAQALIEVERGTMAVEPPVKPPAPESSSLGLVVFDAEVVETKPDAVVLPRKAPTQRRNKKPAREAPIAVPTVTPAAPVAVAVDRRLSYRRLTSLRAIRRGWEKLSPYFGVPNESMVTSSDIYRFLEAVVDTRRALLRLGEAPISAGAFTRAVVVHASPLAVVRDLQKSQRDALAADWALSLAEWKGAEAALANSLKATKRRRTRRQQLRAAKKLALAHPEWKLLAVLVVTAIIAGIRAWR